MEVLWSTSLAAITLLDASVQGAISVARMQSPAGAQTAGAWEGNMGAVGANVAANFEISILPHVCARSVASLGKEADRR